MELNDILLLLALNGVFSLVIGVIIGVLIAYFRDNAVDRRIKSLEHDFDSLVDRINGTMGNEKKAELKEQEAAFMANAAVILKSEGPMPDKIQKIIALDPAMAMKMAKKLGIGL